MTLLARLISGIGANLQNKVAQGGPGSIRLPWRLEDERVAVNALSKERLAESKVGDADGAPRKELGNRREVLEP